MTDQLILKQKNNDRLVSDLKSLITQERKLLTEIIDHLREVERRKLYLQKGWPSLFSWMTECLGYSEGAAQRRIQTMRLVQDLPEVQEKICSGKLSLCVASQLQSSETTHKETTPAGHKKMFPSTQKPLAGPPKRALSQGGMGTEGPSPLTPLPKGEGNHDSSPLPLGEGSGVRGTPPPTLKIKRTIPKPLRDQIWVRDGGRCQYRDKRSGKQCGSQHLLELDHKTRAPRSGHFTGHLKKWPPPRDSEVRKGVVKFL